MKHLFSYSDFLNESKKYKPKKGDIVKVDMGDGPEEVTVLSNIKAGISKFEFIQLGRSKGSPYTIPMSKFNKVLIEESLKTSFINEGVMSDIHLMAKEANDEDEFIDKFFKKYGSKVKRSKSSMEWAKELYADTINEAVATKEQEWILDVLNIASKYSNDLGGIPIGKKFKDVEDLWIYLKDKKINPKHHRDFDKDMKSYLKK